MRLRSALVGGIGLASAILVFASGSLIVQTSNQIAIPSEDFLVLSPLVKLLPASRTPRITGDMSSTFRDLERMTEDVTKPAATPKQRLLTTTVHMPGQAGQGSPSPRAATNPGVKAEPRFAGIPGAVPTALVGAVPAASLDADRQASTNRDRTMPTSLLPRRPVAVGARVGQEPSPPGDARTAASGQVMDTRHTEAFNALMSRPRPISPAATTPGGAALQPDRPGKDESNMTADELNEREHRRHKRSGAGEDKAEAQ